MTVFFNLLFLFIFSQFVFADKDLDYQNRMHQIYVKNYKDPIPYQDWSRAIQNLKNNYTLKHKDNLWDLSGSFFNKHGYWSKLWVANSSIENPHLIYKGNAIQFSLEKLVAVNSSPFSVDLSKQFLNLNIPDSYSRPALIASEIPSSLPQLYLTPQLSSSTIQLSLSELTLRNKAPLPFYISDTKIDTAVGEVVSTTGYNSSAINGENIIIKLPSQVSIGSFYTIMKRKKISYGFFQTLIEGKPYENRVKGEVEVIYYITGSASLYVARVTQSTDSIKAEDEVFSGRIPTYTISKKGVEGYGQGKIIATPSHQGSSLSLYSIAYLNRGLSSGVRKGNLYYIQADKKNSEEQRLIKRPFSAHQSRIGQLKIIHADSGHATGLIVDARYPIYVGDYFTDVKGSILDLEKSKAHESFNDDDENPSLGSKNIEDNYIEDDYEEEDIERENMDQEFESEIDSTRDESELEEDSSSEEEESFEEEDSFERKKVTPSNEDEYEDEYEEEYEDSEEEDSLQRKKVNSSNKDSFEREEGSLSDEADSLEQEEESDNSDNIDIIREELQELENLDSGEDY